MPTVAAYAPRTREAARAAHQAANWTRSICTAFGISQGPRLLYAAVFFELMGRVAERMADDPPRADFNLSTRIRTPFATPEYISSDDPTESAALQSARFADDAEANLAAHLRAFERFQGARKHQREQDATGRGEEAMRFARSSGEALQNVSGALQGLVVLLRSEWDERWAAISERGIRRVQPGDIDDRTLAVLFLGGLRIRDLEKVLSRSRQLDRHSSLEKFSTTPKAFQQFGELMVDWRPPLPEA